MKKITIICSDEKAGPLGSYLISNKIEFECEHVPNAAPEKVEGQKPSTNKQSTPCLCNVGVEYIPQLVRVCSNCGQPK